MFALIPLQSRVFRIIAAKRKTQLALTDKRVKMQNEALSGIKIIKLNAWEAPMLASISAVRAEELAVARNLAYINAFVSCLITTLPTLVAVSAFTLYSAVMKREMAAWIIFPALSLFNQLRFPIMFLPRVLSMCADALVSLKRLQRYIALVESESAAPRMPWPADAAAAAARAPGASSEVLASISGGSFHFAPLQRGESPFLRDVTLELRRGALTLVVGQVGSGKSTLAAALLGEMALCSAATTAPRVNGRVAYVAQSAWVQSITLKENVLFGLPFDQARYEAAVAAACLGPDVALLPNGHDTEIGERGITLSGGQRARVAIARAVYADADVYILDDPLSALDAHVGRAVFNECIRGVLRDKAVLLITHALAYCADADTVLVMDAGRIAEAGPYPTLMAARSKFATLMAEYGSVGAAEEEAEEPSVATLQASGEAAPAAAAAAPAKAAAAPGAGAKMIEAEKREEGSVKWSVFSSYAAAFPGGWHTISVLLLLNVVKQLAAIGSTLWLAVWSGTKLGPSWHDAGYLTVYALFSIAVALVTYLKSVAWTYCGIEAAGALHARLLHAALSVRLTWFDVTPLGRILQRFSKDTDTCDNSLPASWNSTTEFLTGLASVIVTICVIEPTVIPLFLPIGWLYFRVQAYFRASYREIKRLDGVSGSPIYAHFSETLAGLATIRAFGHQARFLGANLARVGANQRAFYAQRCACDRWLPVRLETVGNLIVLAVALLGVPYAGTAYAPFVGLVLSFSLDLTGLLSWVIRQWSETEAGMVSVERVAEYASLPTEEDSVPAERGAREPAPPAWPRAGALRLEALSLRYQPAMPLVLRAVSADIAAGEKVGVVGRTGSGKSTLLVALWRLVEPEPGGRVWLDGVDTSRLPLEQLRGALTCIPQEPVLFSGTMRHNLHPIGAHDGAAAVTDAALWDALDAVGMKRAISATGLGLDAQCAEFGASFSAGERQLLSLARALLRNTKVVCLDEATASVDLESDARMQAVIAQRFAACTVVVIAHRLHTIISSSRIMCMAAGELVAMGSPAALLADPASVFSALVAETGEEALLRAKAAAAAAPSV
jgi:ABC-type multidrug transport system fused ATPase/permease subunit